MLDRRDARFAPAESGTQHGIADVLGMRTDIHGLGQIRPPEHDPLIRAGRPQGHQDFLARVQTDPGRANRVLERPLSNHAACL